MNPFETPAPPPFNLDTASKDISDALIGFVRLSLDAESLKSDPQAGRQFFDSIKNSVVAGMSACGEVKRLQDEFSALRDRHKPRPHADPTTPGALCEACSLNGSLIAWPCETWKAADKALTHHQH